ncbi:hypothetical protein J4E89_008756 [Alternaria sp. Ai002NY15]|nr:hypothetical protein J4E89_008756 [Alternaria sp. Ai002NY15]
MATFNHDKIGVYIMALKDKYHLSDASRNSPGMTVDAELLEARGSALFNTIQLCTAISHGCSADSVRKYLEHYRNDKEEFQEIVDLSTPALYYAIGRNSPELINVLLDYGKYTDRRTNREVDCSKTIWILGDEAIKTYYNRELAHLTDDHKQEADLVPLVDELMDLFKGRWGDAFESRVDKVVPFFPFSLGEQAVVAHKLLLSSAPKVRKDIDYRHEVKRHMSHCHVSFQHDGELCIHLAKKVTLPGLEHAD